MRHSHHECRINMCTVCPYFSWLKQAIVYMDALSEIHFDGPARGVCSAVSSSGFQQCDSVGQYLQCVYKCSDKQFGCRERIAHNCRLLSRLVSIHLNFGLLYSRHWRLSGIDFRIPAAAGSQSHRHGQVAYPDGHHVPGINRQLIAPGYSETHKQRCFYDQLGHRLNRSAHAPPIM